MDELIRQLRTVVSDGLTAQAGEARRILEELQRQPDSESALARGEALVEAALHDPDLHR
ncbi:MAG: hypothetical protein KDC39_13045 [Actinobacteria bacterium]|nr:hypothetical protein [Actinomycetota bacterium]